ncbi:hypothetical protein [Puia sp.]|jgi:hypothetical protein|uniref:hypothetical protein n=1 Tax=Puia sp. TaxID=2045100 RepID=UPI002F3FD7D9
MQSKHLLFALSAVTLLAVFASCKKSNDNSSAAVSATIGGAAFNPVRTAAAHYAANGYFDLGGLGVNGKDSVLLDITIGTPFTLNKVLDNSGLVTMDYFTATKDYYSAYGIGTATVTVTTLDSVNHKIAGTFSGTLYNSVNDKDSISVINGKFNTAYTEQ